MDIDALATKRQKARFAFALLLALAVALALVGGGLYVRSVVTTALGESDRTRNARAHVNDMLRHQLDEETGIRGYAAAPVPILLQPYYGGRAAIPADFRLVRSDLDNLHAREALPALRDAEALNDRWLHEVAFPLIQNQGQKRTLLLRGKTMVDRFRADASSIYVDLTRRTAAVNGRASAGLSLAGICAIVVLFFLVIGSLIFAIRQRDLGLQLEQQRAQAERERRKSAEARSAYETEKRLADTLQEALSQRTFPEVPTARFSATYVPATEETKIGGDWYDALQLSDNRVLVGIGDVTGHGIDAVVAMNKARQLMIGAALLDANPARVLDRVNATLVRTHSRIISACAGVIDTKSREFTYAAAGHPPPVLLEPGARAKMLEVGSIAMGVTDDVSYHSHTVQTVPGAMLVFYTDGLIEYSRDVVAGEAALLEAVESVGARQTADAAAEIRDRIFADRNVGDDVAILTIHLEDTPLKTNGKGE